MDAREFAACVLDAEAAIWEQRADDIRTKGKRYQRRQLQQCAWELRVKAGKLREESGDDTAEAEADHVAHS